MRRLLAAAGLSLWVGCAGQEAWVEEPGADVLQSVPGDIQQALRALPRAEVVALHPGGVPSFVRGELSAGRLDGAAALQAAVARLAPVFRLSAEELQA
ncbi:MAG: hypothetical protein FJ086_15220, partial [Deltaproteobacteria bacterium]|nr:hypothetical protein [Deltaproteobacteria bacterium]